MKAVLALLIALMATTACQRSGVAKQRGQSKDMFPDQESWGSEVIITKEGHRVAQAISQRMIKYDQQNLAHLIGEVAVDFYSGEGRHVSRLFADSADVDFLTNNLSAFGNVTVFSDSGHVLQTETLTWRNEYDMISTNDSVMFASPQFDTLYGVGFESDVDLTHWKIYRPTGVTGRGLSDDR